jgi:type VI secretion system protein ImpL
VPLGFSASSLAEFERAAQIRDALFSGGKEMQVRFQLVPVSLDPQIGQMVLDIAGAAAHLRPRAAGIRALPVAGRGRQDAGAHHADAHLGRPGGGDREGRTLGAAAACSTRPRLTPSGQPDKFRITFSGAGGSGTFELLATSVNNPFTMTALRSFRCPPKL